MQMPENTVAVTPHLTVRDLDRAVDFYQRAFGFGKKFTLPGQGGRTMHAELTHNGCTIMLGPESAERGLRSPASLGASPVSLMVYVDDVDALHARATREGATELVPCTDQFFGARTCVLLDLDGHQWMFAQHMRAVTPEEMTGAIHDRHI